MVQSLPSPSFLTHVKSHACCHDLTLLFASPFIIIFYFKLLSSRLGANRVASTNARVDSTEYLRTSSINLAPANSRPAAFARFILLGEGLCQSAISKHPIQDRCFLYYFVSFLLLCTLCVLRLSLEEVVDRERESIFLVGNQLFETIDRLDRGGKQDDSFYLPLSRANAFVPAAIAAAQKGESERQSRERESSRSVGFHPCFFHHARL